MSPPDEDSYSVVLSRITGLQVRRLPDGKPALYQPLTLLWSIGRLQQQESRLLDWPSTKNLLGEFLGRHGMRGERRRPDYPIAALYRAGLWELRGHHGAVPPAHGDSALRRWFDVNAPEGGLAADVHELLHRFGAARIAASGALLANYFDDVEVHGLIVELELNGPNAVADLVSAPLTKELSARRPLAYQRLYNAASVGAQERHGSMAIRQALAPLRHQGMRRAVLERSNGYCENPECRTRLDDVTDAGSPILEVDHVIPLAEGGADDASQMIALCPNCHAIKTRGRTRSQLQARLLVAARAAHASALDGRDTE